MTRLTCEQSIMNYFMSEAKGRMICADELKKRNEVSNFALSTIKTKLSALKKKDKLTIPFRTRGPNMKKNKNLTKKGKCYYKLKEK